MASGIEVRIQGKGSVKDGNATKDASQKARCDLCGQDVDAVASTGPAASGPFGCKACLRARLEAMTLGGWLLREPGEGIPWGKVSG
jgi:hypothetical protein